MFVPGEDWRVPERWKGRLSVASFVTPQLIAQLAAERSRLLRLEARAFEELCAELLARLGATSVRLTPEGHDRGVDIWATVGGRTGETLCAVQCKRFTPPRPVGRPVLQQMWSIRSTSPARVVAVITTAHFTRDALAYQSDVGSQFALHDGDAVSAWLEACSRQDLPWGA
jgi:restriction endonuclease Mrr